MNNEQVTLTVTPELQEANGLCGRLKKIQNRIVNAPASYLAYCFIIPTVIMFLMYVAMEIYPFGTTSVLVLDLHGQYVFFHEALRNAIYGEGSFFYSFYRALGGEFMGIYAYYLASPLSYLVALFPQSAIQEAILTIILLKVGLCGFTFGFYLHKHTKNPSRMVVLTFSCMYALCAYSIVYQNNLMWLDALIWLPILTYSIEQLIRHSHYKLFVISLAMTVMSNYYIGYMVCIYVALYFFYDYFSHTSRELNPRGTRLHFLRALLRIALFSLVAIAIAAFVILGAYYSLTFGKTTFSDPNWSFQTKFKFLDFFTKFLPGSYDTVHPEGLPWVYTGILTLFLVPVYFMSRKFSSREKIASLFFIAFFVLSFIASPLDLIWHGFQKPNWLNYRQSFLLCFFLLVLAYKGIGNMRRVGERFLLGICAFLILFVTVCDKLEFETYLKGNESLKELDTVWLTIFASITILVVLCLMIRHRKPKMVENVSALLVAVVCMELFFSGVSCMVQFDNEVLYGKHSGERGYYDYFENLRPVVEEVKEADDSFYRMEKIVHRKYNDNMALSMRGISGSTSTLNAETIRFLGRLGYTSRSHLSQYRGGNPVNDSLIGIKYIIDKTDSDKLTHTYNAVASDEHYTAYYNEYALSLAYGVDSSISGFEWNDRAIYFENLNRLVGSMLGDTASGRIFKPVRETTMTPSPFCSVRTSGTQTTYENMVNDQKAYFTHSFVAPTSAEYYFYTPGRSLTETTISVNEEELGAYLGSNSRHIVSLGYYEAGELVDVKITLKDDPLTLYNNEYYAWYIDQDAFESAFDALGAGPQLMIDDSYREDHLTGTLTTTEDEQMILTTIPYDEGWKVLVDGEQVEIYKSLDALVSFDVAASGEHTIELRYSPTVYHVGMIVSISGLGILIAICVADHLIRRRKKKDESTPIPQNFWILEDFAENEEEAALDSANSKHSSWGLKDLFRFLTKKSTPDDLPMEEEHSPEETDDSKGDS